MVDPVVITSSSELGGPPPCVTDTEGVMVMENELVE